MNSSIYLTFKVFYMNISINVNTYRDRSKREVISQAIESDSVEIEPREKKTTLEMRINKNNYLTFKKIPTTSNVEYLNDDGKISHQTFHQITDEINLIKKQNVYREYKMYRMNFNKEIFYNQIERNQSNQEEEIGFKSNGDKNILFLSTNSSFSYYLAKLLYRISVPTLKYNFTEFEYVPFAVQVFFHVPLIITALIVFFVIVTFDPEITMEMIRDEIEKLPERKLVLEERCVIATHENMENNVKNTSIPDINECTICLESYVDGDTVVDLPCMHYFHKGCISSWLLNSLHCPVCRKSVSKLTETQSYAIYRSNV